MIAGIYSSSPYFQVASPGMPYVASGPNSGQMRWNTQTNMVEVSNGSGWQPFGGHANISASPEFQQIMDWAKQEMTKSAAIKKLAESSPAVADALKTYELAAEQLKVVAILAEKESA
jgi:hypothetical protein